MYSRSLVILVTLLAGLGLPSVSSASSPSQPRSASSLIVVANRASGTISVIDANVEAVVGTYALPADPNPPEPMYVAYSRGRVFVGDRANSRVVVFDSVSFAIVGMAAAGAGVFHMWIDPDGGKLWVNNDVDKTASVIDSVSLVTLATVPMPADLVALGSRPHDVVLDPRNGRFAFVSMIGVPGPNDYVVKFDMTTYDEVDRAAVGKDPHISATRHNTFLYVPCQNSNVVTVLERATLAHVRDIPVPGAHGAGMAPNGRRFYTTNITSAGPAGVYTINTLTNRRIGEAGDTGYPMPHNIAFTPNGQKFFMTHSGATSDKVTIHAIVNDAPPALVGEVSVGLNPFGLAVVP
jgi:DNA-binding beta-propeller fold protein YncE